jgi:DNA-binding NarL/FixJ family response regulator
LEAYGLDCLHIQGESGLFKLLVVEDHTLVREGLLQTLGGLVQGAHPLGANDAETALVRLEENPDIELVILDLMLPGLNGTSFLGVLRKRFPSVPVVVLSALEDFETVRKVMRQGASGFVGKSSSSETLVAALQKVLAGEVYLSEKYVVTEEKPAQETKVHLTPTQMRVLDLLAEGYSNRQIAELLGVTVGTVKMHFVNIYKALSVKTRAQALIAMKKRKIKF